MRKLNWSMKACGIYLLWAASAIALPAQTTADAPTGPVYTTLYSFSGKDGAGPTGGLVQATDGNLYGTTQQGGPNGGRTDLAQSLKSPPAAP
jgi:hypothetical protein